MSLLTTSQTVYSNLSNLANLQNLENMSKNKSPFAMISGTKREIDYCLQDEYEQQADIEKEVKKRLCKGFLKMFDNNLNEEDYTNNELIDLVCGKTPDNISVDFKSLIEHIDKSNPEDYLNSEFVDSNYSVISSTLTDTNSLLLPDKQFNASFEYVDPCGYEYFVMVLVNGSRGSKCANYVMSTICKFFKEIVKHNIPSNYTESEDMINMKKVLKELLELTHKSSNFNKKIFTNSYSCMSQIKLFGYPNL